MEKGRKWELGWILIGVWWFMDNRWEIWVGEGGCLGLRWGLREGGEIREEMVEERMEVEGR